MPLLPELVALTLVVVAASRGRRKAQARSLLSRLLGQLAELRLLGLLLLGGKLLLKLSAEKKIKTLKDSSVSAKTIRSLERLNNLGI